MEAAVEIGSNPVSKFSLNLENEQADAGRDGRTRLVRPNPQALMRTGKYPFPLFI